MAEDTNGSAPVDNAKGLTTTLVILTTVVLLAAIFVGQKALGQWFGVGMMKLDPFRAAVGARLRFPRQPGNPPGLSHFRGRTVKVRPRHGRDS